MRSVLDQGVAGVQTLALEMDNPRARHCCRFTEGHVSAPAGRVTALDSPAASWRTGGPSVGG
jgi:hypothetical protein